VVVLAGRVPGPVLAAVSRSLNVVLVRPEPATEGLGAALPSGAEALRRAARVSAAYVLVAADPLAAVAAEWRAMWEISAQARGSEDFEIRAAEALGAWRANQFELPDYYLYLGEPGPAGNEPEARPDFYLGPLRAVRPHRVAAVTASEPAEQATALLSELGSLRHGPWWPPLDEILLTAREFYPGALAESPGATGAVRLA
jgi:hypothetical protein